MKCVLIDDVQLNTNLLETLIVDYCSTLEVIGKFTTLEEALTVILKEEDLLIFLDIELSNGTSGFDIFKEISHRNDKVIIVTAFEEFALNAYRNGVIDYLVKPVLISDLQRAVSKVERFSGEPAPEKVVETIDRVGIKIYNKYVFVDKSDIQFVISRISKCEIHFSNRDPITASMRIGEVEELLSNENFIRVHKTYLVNINYLSAAYWKGKSIVLVFGEMEIPVARRKSAEIRKIIQSKTSKSI